MAARTTPRSRAALATVAAAAAAVLALAGCSGGGDEDDAAAKPPASQQEGDRATKDPGPADEEKADGTEKVPEEDLEPAEGEFSEKEKTYLKDRVPEGVDPAAILEAGEEACAKIESAAATDDELAREAIRSGDIAHAEDAIHTLCPQYEDLL
ncbi:hypothetical protein DMB38_07530 [Streptomyces sp. WAC 06738]|uniref:hypothetical protein n=1 Tax=Streptomyces sp. WAC 06738 TaxID=2203210 RepID=UPI000F72096B|nr:hypothetical protein [Streptomyces sp. WAC 06738]AZM45707.1 hypothetical protein DMB38_07530 [Streptomyces sp. WAC 06738]